MNKKLTVFLFTTSMILTFCLQVITAELPKTVFDSDLNETLTLRKSFRGKYTNLGFNEFMSFYYYKTKVYDESLYGKVIVYIVKNKKILKKFDINETSLHYSKYSKSVIKQLEPAFGKWNGYYYSYDLNRNGINEIFMFYISGMEFSIIVYEFRDNKFIKIISTTYDSKTPLEMLNKIRPNINNNSITLYGIKEFYTFKWNRKMKLYEVIKKGSHKP